MWFFGGTLAVAYLLHVSGSLEFPFASKLNQPCNSEMGHCVALIDCPELQEKIRNKILEGSFIMDLLWNSSCGIVGANPYFCCPLTLETTSEVSRPPEEHPNLQLLPRHICGVDTADRILGGREANLKQFPWMALLQLEKDDGLKIICGGSLINEYYILTAAHCINNENDRKSISVCLGEHDILTNPDCDGEICSDLLQTFTIEEFIKHPQYDRKKKIGDIALIRLNRKAMFTDYVFPICLPAAESLTKRFLERHFIVAGWGATEIEIASEVKQWIRVPVVDNNKCAETLHVTMDETMMCAGTVEGKATCIGDSGGPLMMQESAIPFRPGEQWVAVAVVQGGSWICGTKDVPGLYTRVGPYVDWILDNMKP